MIVSGIAYRLQPLVRRILGTDCSFWPTPNTIGYRTDGELRMLSRLVSPEEYKGMTERATKSKRVKFYPTPHANCSTGAGSGPNKQGGENLQTAVGGQLNPQWVEWLMGFPVGWTDCEVSETL